MTRITIEFDSATPQQVYDATLAFQRTLGYGLPQQITDKPTVTVAGTRLGWRSPALKPEHALALLKEYDALQGRALSEAKPILARIDTGT
jgi:hypothetical protein